MVLMYKKMRNLKIDILSNFYRSDFGIQCDREPDSKLKWLPSTSKKRYIDAL